VAIIDSARPVILESRKKSQEAFQVNMVRTFSLVNYLALAQSVCFTLLAFPIVKILYGDEYLAAFPVIQIVVWYTSFSCMGSVRNIWILAEGKQSVLWIVNLSGALLNVVLNWMMIPYFGACGAAAASVATQFFTNFLIGFLLKPISGCNKLILRGFNPKYIFDVIRR
jgi:O-antigen/teichoic acid export membrane protein